MVLNYVDESMYVYTCTGCFVYPAVFNIFVTFADTKKCTRKMLFALERQILRFVFLPFN